MSELFEKFRVEHGRIRLSDGDGFIVRTDGGHEVSARFEGGDFVFRLLHDPAPEFGHDELAPREAYVRPAGWWFKDHHLMTDDECAELREASFRDALY